MLHLFVCCTLFMLHLFSRCFMLPFFGVVLIRVTHFPYCTFSMLPFFMLHLFSSCTFFELHSFIFDLFLYCILLICHLFLWCTLALFWVFIFFVLFHVGPCCILMLEFLSSTIFMFFFSYHSVFIMNIFGGAIFSCRTIFRVAMFSCCTFGTLFSCCAFFRVEFFSCFTFFLLHIFFCSSLFMLQFFMLYFFRFGPSILTCFLFYSFHGGLFRCCFSSHCALFTLHPSMMHSFHVAPFFSSTFLMLYFFHKALSHGNLPCSAYIMLLPLRLHFFIFYFSWLHTFIFMHFCDVALFQVVPSSCCIFWKHLQSSFILCTN